MLDRSTARPSPKRENGVLPAPLRCRSQRLPSGASCSPAAQRGHPRGAGCNHRTGGPHRPGPPAACPAGLPLAATGEPLRLAHLPEPQLTKQRTVQMQQSGAMQRLRGNRLASPGEFGGKSVDQLHGDGVVPAYARVTLYTAVGSSRLTGDHDYSFQGEDDAKVGLYPALLALAWGHQAKAADIDAGKAKSVVCAACHGADGKASVPTYPPRGPEPGLSAQADEGVQGGSRTEPLMVPFMAMLTEADMENLAAYYASLK